MYVDSLKVTDDTHMAIRVKCGGKNPISSANVPSVRPSLKRSLLNILPLPDSTVAWSATWPPVLGGHPGRATRLLWGELWTSAPGCPWPRPEGPGPAAWCHPPGGGGKEPLGQGAGSPAGVGPRAGSLAGHSHCMHLLATPRLPPRGSHMQGRVPPFWAPSALGRSFCGSPEAGAAASRGQF